MTRPLPALTVLLALLALPLASAQHGPPPGYTDPVAYAQDYAANQTGQASADPVGYASGHATPGAAGNETTHALWLACWTAWYESMGAAGTDPVCATVFTPPGRVDAPGDEAKGEITGVENGTQALVGNATDAVDAIVADPASAPSEAVKLLHAVIDFVCGLVGGILDVLGLGGLGLVEAVKGAVDGILETLGLGALGIQSAAGGLGLGLGAVADGAAATVRDVAS